MPPPQYAYAAPGFAYAPQPYVQVAYAGFWIRVVGYVIDAIILGVLGFVIGILFGITAAIANPSAASGTQADTTNAVLNLVSLLLSFAYFAGLWTLNGASFGQRVLGLRVADATTLQPPRPGQAALRWLGLVVSFLVCFVGVIWVAFDGRKQGWMDKMAGTVVVHG
jgi:uncharacterized RDD family membrane protein YckC